MHLSSSSQMATPTAARSHSSLRRVPSCPQVRVVVRVRPFLSSEVAQAREGTLPCVSLFKPSSDSDRVENEVTLLIKDQFSSRNHCFKLDAFFAQNDVLMDLFNCEVKPVIPEIFRGLNATVFAYGATGSGKTYTMQGTEEHPGLIPQAMSTILDISQCNGSLVEICYYEIYLDRCYDLLEPKANEISVLEDSEGNVLLKDLCLVKVHSLNEFNEAFSSGLKRRKVAPTGLNDVSSRSHGVLSVVVSSEGAKGKLNLVDLAGNEDNRRTCNEGIRLHESCKINQSLFALSNVIYALNNNETRVPYRQSKLTRILQDSLGGTSRSLMVACLNPGSYPEAVHTISLAARSRHIDNYVCTKQESPKEVVDMETKLAAWLESKGKTKSLRRLNDHRSPFMWNTPISGNCSTSKKPDGNNSLLSVSKPNRKDFLKGSASRKLFDATTAILATTTSSEKDHRGLSANELDRDHVSNMTLADGKNESSEKDHRGLSANELDGDHVSNMNLADGKMVAHRTSINSIPVVDVLSESRTDSGQHSHICNRDSISPDDQHSDVNQLHTTVSKMKISHNENVCDLQKSIRKVLSPVNSILSPLKHSLLDEKCSFEVKTPTVSMAKQTNGESPIGTPLDMFNQLSSNLKDSLAKEYIAFLNVASKEELVALKGIGEKRADYIFGLRETTPLPFRSLEDLKKIGLSTKQAHDLFRRAARDIFQ